MFWRVVDSGHPNPSVWAWGIRFGRPLARRAGLARGEAARGPRHAIFPKNEILGEWTDWACIANLLSKSISFVHERHDFFCPPRARFFCQRKTRRTRNFLSSKGSIFLSSKGLFFCPRKTRRARNFLSTKGSIFLSTKGTEGTKFFVLEGLVFFVHERHEGHEIFLESKWLRR